MKPLKTYIFLILLSGCYVPNDPPSSKFSFPFEGRVEKLEDAFFQTELDYKENFYWVRAPEFEFIIHRNDTIINYEVTLEDCQSIYYLINFNDDWNCNYSNVNIMHYETNIDSIPLDRVKKIFNDEVIIKIRKSFDSIKSKYHWKINEISADSVIVDILSQNNDLRKRHFFSTDTVMNSLAQKELISLVGDSIYIYKKMERQRYMYYESKKTLHNNGYK